MRTTLDNSLPVNSKWIKLAPGERTLPHHHPDYEIWHLLKGEAIITQNNISVPAHGGDTILIQPLDEHSIQNTSPDHELEFISLWWQHLVDNKNSLLKNNPALQKPQTKQRIFILPSFPTPNGDLHLGHLAGPYLAADIYKRYQQMLGNEAIYLLGTIGYQSQVACQAEKLQLSFDETSKQFSKKIQKTLAAAQITPDVFVTLENDSDYQQINQAFFSTLHQQGFIVLKNKLALYCEHCQHYLFEAYATGICPHCQSPGASSNECENCAYLHEDEQLISAHCTQCNQPATLKTLERFYFPLEPWRDKLKDFYANCQLSHQLQIFIEKIFQQPLPEFPVSHLAKEGIPIPLQQHAKQKLYSLFELAPRYVAALKNFSAQQGKETNWKQLIKNSTTGLFFGFDNAFLRAIIFPAVLLAFDPKIPLPELLLSNEFYTLDGHKFSTSRDHAIWGIDFLKQYPSDFVRFYLSYTRPENQQTDFKLTEFRQFYQQHLSDTLASWLKMLFIQLSRHCDQRAPEADRWSFEGRCFYEDIHFVSYKINQCYQNRHFPLSTLCQHLLTFIKLAKCFSQLTNRLYELPAFDSQTTTDLALGLMAVKTFCILSFPIMPTLTTLLWKALGYQQELSTVDPQTTTTTWVTPGQKLNNIQAVLKLLVTTQTPPAEQT